MTSDDMTSDDKTKKFENHRALMKAAKNALEVQIACNLSGVSMSYINAVKAVNASTDVTALRNEHPIMVLFLDKMAQLAGIQTEIPGYHNWYKAVEKIMRTYPELETVEDIQLFFPKFRMSEECKERITQIIAFSREIGITDKFLWALDYAHEWGNSDYVHLHSSSDCGSRSFTVIPMKCKHSGEAKVNPGGYRMCREEDERLYYMGMVFSNNAAGDGPGWSFHS